MREEFILKETANRPNAFRLGFVGFDHAGCQFVQKCRESIEENSEFIDYCAKKNSPMIKAMFGMHAAFTLSDKTLSECVRLNDGRTGFHIHVAEGMDDVKDSLENHGMRTVNRLYEAGILGRKTILGHCIHVDGDEMELIRATDSMVVNNPESNMGNAVGCSPVLKLFEKGILVGLGTDAYTNDMLESLKAALAIQRHNAKLPNVGVCSAGSVPFVRMSLSVQSSAMPRLL